MKTHTAVLFLTWVCSMGNAVSADTMKEKDTQGMVRVTGGTFVSGSPGAFKERNVASFYLDTTEVTQEAYQNAIGVNPAFFKGPQRPVEGVNWFEALEYCRKVGKRLPTEEEWEKAARAGTKTRYPWGDEMNDRFAWHKGNAEKSTHPVGVKEPNPLGLHDMAGNVWEWTLSDHEVQGKVVRGGSWRNTHISLRSFHRILTLPNQRFHYVGFRCARSALEPPTESR